MNGETKVVQIGHDKEVGKFPRITKPKTAQGVRGRGN